MGVKRVMYAQTTGPRAMFERTLDERIAYEGAVMTRRELVDILIAEKKPMSEIIMLAFAPEALNGNREPEELP